MTPTLRRAISIAFGLASVVSIATYVILLKHHSTTYLLIARYGPVFLRGTPKNDALIPSLVGLAYVVIPQIVFLLTFLLVLVCAGSIGKKEGQS